MKKFWYERVVSSLAQDGCVVPYGLWQVRPVIVVIKDIASAVEVYKGLSILAAAFSSSKVIESMPPPIIKKSNEEYICRKRYEASIKEYFGATFSDEKSNPSLFIKGIREEVRKKVMVVECDSISCRLFTKCNHGKLVRRLRNGEVKMQIYTNKQYDAAQKKGEIPRRCVVIGAQAPAHVQSLEKKEEQYKFNELDFKTYINNSTNLLKLEGKLSAESKKCLNSLDRAVKAFFSGIVDEVAPKISRGRLTWIKNLMAELSSLGDNTLYKNPSWVRKHKKITHNVHGLLAAENPFHNVVVAKTRNFTFGVEVPKGKIEKFLVEID